MTPPVHHNAHPEISLEQITPAGKLQQSSRVDHFLLNQQCKQHRDGTRPSQTGRQHATWQHQLRAAHAAARGCGPLRPAASHSPRTHNPTFNTHNPVTARCFVPCFFVICECMASQMQLDRPQPPGLRPGRLAAATAGRQRPAPCLRVWLHLPNGRSLPVTRGVTQRGDTLHATCTPPTHTEV